MDSPCIGSTQDLPIRVASQHLVFVRQKYHFLLLKLRLDCRIVCAKLTELRSCLVTRVGSYRH